MGRIAGMGICFAGMGICFAGMGVVLAVSEWRARW
jgi:hypothetical protein